MTGAVPLRNSLSRFHSDRRDPDRVARDGWKEQGVAVFNMSDSRLAWHEKQVIEQIANRIYGERNQ